MRDLNDIIKDLIRMREQGIAPVTLLAVCPNSSAVLEAAVNAASRYRCVMLFAATLNQVDFEASYTGWTQAGFVREMQEYADKYNWAGPLYPCLDHGGPWLKDLHTLANLSYDETMEKVKHSISACIQAGYKLLHIDPTVDRSRPADEPLPLELVVQRTVELMEYAEKVRCAFGLPKLAYEVGTEEVHGGLVDIRRFEAFLDLLQSELSQRNLSDCWPCLLVAQIGTDLHTTTFKPEVAKQLYEIVKERGSLIKGHYTDWVETPQDYPTSGMGSANVGPEFTAQEYQALRELEVQEIDCSKPVAPSQFMLKLQNAVIESQRWKKWLLPEEKGINFEKLTPHRKDWLLETGSRYIWTDTRVLAAREILYRNLGKVGIDANAYVLERITQGIEKYIRAFNLENSVDLLRG
jgi:D-tagatose-1,6-bisphosphate aldolase subunit GatZ/KbaZ